MIRRPTGPLREQPADGDGVPVHRDFAMLPPLVKLATSAAPGEAKYVCLAGAGLSKDAGLPTAWDLMIETAALLRAAEEDDSTDLQTWFMSSKYKYIKYS